MHNSLDPEVEGSNLMGYHLCKKAMSQKNVVNGPVGPRPRAKTATS